jgi:hypothetical protein
MKLLYLAPTTEQLPMDALSVMANSTGGSLPSDYTGVDGNSDLFPLKSGGAGYGNTGSHAASGRDLEDMINDILTY